MSSHESQPQSNPLSPEWFAQQDQENGTDASTEATEPTRFDAFKDASMEQLDRAGRILKLGGGALKSAGIGIKRFAQHQYEEFQIHRQAVRDMPLDERRRFKYDKKELRRERRSRVMGTMALVGMKVPGIDAVIGFAREKRQSSRNNRRINQGWREEHLLRSANMVVRKKQKKEWSLNLSTKPEVKEAPLEVSRLRGRLNASPITTKHSRLAKNIREGMADKETIKARKARIDEYKQKLNAKKQAIRHSRQSSL